MSVNTSIGIGLVSVILAACASTPDLDEVETELELAASYKARIKSRTLSITGTNANSRLRLRLGVDAGDDGSPDFRLDRSAFERAPGRRQDHEWRAGAGLAGHRRRCKRSREHQSGLSASVWRTCPDAFDQLHVYGGAGTDAFMTGPGVGSMLSVTTYQDW